MRNQLERAINLAAKTGDKIIVVDELNDRSSVVMNLDEYEKLLNSENKINTEIENLTEEELLDKINHDIVTWREANKDGAFLEEIDDLGDEIDEESPFAKATEDKDDEEWLLPDFTAPLPIVDDEMISEEKEEEKVEEIKETPEENLYYYNEPASAEASPYAEATGDKTAGKPENDNMDSGFTSIKDELRKNKKAWEIPAEVKQAAEDARI